MEINIPQKKDNKKLRFIIVFIALGIFLAIARLLFLYYMTSLKEIQLPDVVGLKYYEAFKLLSDLKLKPVLGAQKQSREYEQDVVMEMIPAAGRKAKEGNKIYLIVSSGIKKITVPNLIGETMLTAQKLALENNFKLEEKGQYSMTIDEGEIVSQNPTSGEDMEDGATINILVSLGFPVKLKAVDLGMKNGDHQFLIKINVLMPDTWDQAEVIVSIKSEGVDTKLFQGNINPGEKKYLEKHLNPSDSVEIYYGGKLIISKKAEDIGD